jgi:hypothetical protein
MQRLIGSALLIAFVFSAPIANAQQVRVSNKNSSLTVYAGADQTITLPASAALSGSVIAKPSRLKVTSLWTMEAGPGTATFANAQSPITTVSFTSGSFTAPGTYILALTAKTSSLMATSKVVITVNAATPPPPIVKPIGLGWDAVASTPTAPVTGYNLWRLNPDGSWTKVYDGPDTSATDAGVEIGSTYTYAVRAVNSAGCDVTPCESAPSNFVTVTAVAQ